MEILQLLLTCGVAAALVTAGKELILWRWGHKAHHARDMHDLQQAQRVILHDRIKYLGRSFIQDGQIDIGDRKDLVEMHEIYHGALGGNGNLKHLMEEVMKLPLKR